MNGATVRRDEDAGDLLRTLREDLGLSPEEVPREMLRRGIPRRNVPSGKTIRRVEEGMIPQVRFRFGLAALHGRVVHSIWQSDTAVRR